ncbi:MAG: hypothetical protein ACI4WT_03815 [Oligosphaeraceae bacterium]
MSKAGSSLKIGMVTLAAAALLTALSAHGEEPSPVAAAEESSWRPTVTYSQSWSSRNMGEGVVTNPRSIAESALSLEWQGLSVGVTGIYDFTDDAGYDNDFEEWDYILGYSRTFEDLGPLGAVTAGLTWTYYDIPRASQDDYQELTLALSLDDIPLTPSLEINWDYENGTWWFKGAIAHSLELIPERLSWESTLELHYGNSRWTGLDKAAFTTAVLTTGPSLTLTDHVSLDANVALAHGIDSAMRQALRDDEANHATNVVFTVAINLEF